MAFASYERQIKYNNRMDSLVGGGLDFVETKVIAERAYKWFMLGDYSIKGEENDTLVD